MKEYNEIYLKMTASKFKLHVREIGNLGKREKMLELCGLLVVVGPSRKIQQIKEEEERRTITTVC